MKFNQFNLSEAILNAIRDLGFEDASEIQSQAIPLLLERKDLIGQSGTGTGKTAAFAIPAIQAVNKEDKSTQVLVLCPTRELVVQVTEQFIKLLKHQRGIHVLAAYGGQSMGLQFKELKKGSQIVIGTPGRLMDHLRRGSLRLNNLKTVILDEADQMLDMGFRDDIDTILRQTPSGRQTVMFSATMPQELVKLMQKHQKNPQFVKVGNTEQQSAQIEQKYFDIRKSSKVEGLKQLINLYKIKSALIFCNTKIEVERLSERLATDGLSSSTLHGGMQQRKRDAAMRRFKNKEVSFLVATDVAARGLDVVDLEAVINFDLPRDDQGYVHRIGRTGRAGKAGLALSLVRSKEIETIKRVARRNRLQISAA